MAAELAPSLSVRELWNTADLSAKGTHLSERGQGLRRTWCLCGKRSVSCLSYLACNHNLLSAIANGQDHT